MGRRGKNNRQGGAGTARVKGEPVKSQSPYYYGEKPIWIEEDRNCVICSAPLSHYNKEDRCNHHFKGQVFFAGSSKSSKITPGVRHTGSKNE